MTTTTQPRCFGDAAGIGGGVRSGTVGGEVKPTSGSSTIFIEGKALVREGDTCTMNNGNVTGKYVTVDASEAYAMMAKVQKAEEEVVLFAGPGIGPSNQDISDYTGIPKDKIDAAANTLGGFNQMWSFGASDAIAGRPDPNSAGTKAGQVAGMAAGTYTGSSTYSGIKAAQASRAAGIKNANSIPRLPSTRTALRKDLESKGFKRTGGSSKYEVWKKDAVGESGQMVVNIKPTGEVIRTQKVWKKDGSGKYSERQDYFGNRLEDQSHSTGHYVK
ncbi:PAAR-like domain-containing protein [Psychrobacter celer]|uniref:PAAR-like domain-containing protein n=1 Tax=Psychrobacter celer TaxID=306572 RepID=UPI003FD3621B